MGKCTTNCSENLYNSEMNFIDRYPNLSENGSAENIAPVLEALRIQLTYDREELIAPPGFPSPSASHTES